MENEPTNTWGRTPDCPAIEQLLSVAESTGPNRGKLDEHVNQCPACQTELSLFREFAAPQYRAGEEAQVRRIVSGLDWRSVSRRTAKVRWWNAPTRWVWLGSAAMACAALLVAVDISRTLNPGGNMNSRVSERSEITRSRALKINTSLLDLSEAPRSLDWQGVQSAIRYEVTIAEIDHTEIFHQMVTTPSLLLPVSVASLLVPGKTTTVRIVALDGSNSAIADSGPQKLRVVRGGH